MASSLSPVASPYLPEVLSIKDDYSDENIERASVAAWNIMDRVDRTVSICFPWAPLISCTCLFTGSMVAAQPSEEESFLGGPAPYFLAALVLAVGASFIAGHLVSNNAVNITHYQWSFVEFQRVLNDKQFDLPSDQVACARDITLYDQSTLSKVCELIKKYPHFAIIEEREDGLDEPPRSEVVYLQGKTIITRSKVEERIRSILEAIPVDAHV